MYYDQCWLDLVPSFFEGASILRDPGCNVAHWNVPERHPRLENGAVMVDDKRARFFHFSGFEADRSDIVTRHVPSLAIDKLGETADLFRRYANLLAAAGYHQSKTWPYAYGHFDNGAPISDAVRSTYRGLGDEARRFDNRFETAGAQSYFQWLNAQANNCEAPEETART